MSYLTQYAARVPASVTALRQAARIDERTLLNRPGYFGEAYVQVFVEDTSRRRLRRRRGRPPSPRLVLEIADCTNEINLEFDLTTEGHRENALFKIETLLAALHRFRDGLAAEAELYAKREQTLRLTGTRRNRTRPGV